ncbi:MAG: hypothetical protein A3G96_03390 [Gammaproteobacteria bacterium RIFCSPLOWO2_12_FULL_52_10]|nr:MAG: hypothetical protein A3G96_03390 [Gammaproteobacteria bacterium RIFCSPLOWO2_12_FULL_52_10]
MLCYSDVIPKQFHRSSGLDAHTFNVTGTVYHTWRKKARDWPCKVWRDGAWQSVLVPIAKFPAEVEALAILSEIDGETEREGRYINIHSAYEAVVELRTVDLSAIRHALAHPVTSLTRPDVRATLEHYFGGPYIDLTCYDHKKVFYTCIARMLIAIDEALFLIFTQRWNELLPHNDA